LRDPKDIPILMGAIEARCDFLFTGDSACFGEYYGMSMDGTVVLKPGKFMARLGALAAPKSSLRECHAAKSKTAVPLS